jgi:rhamnogalacturonan endolyase
MNLRFPVAAVALSAISFACPAQTGERIDRGLVALRNADGSVYVGWRLLASDGNDAAFNLYRRAADKDERLTPKPLADSTNFVDSTATKEGKIAYFVRPVVAGREGDPSPPILVADAPPGGSYVSIKLAGAYDVQKVAVADLDGDGRYDFVIKQPNHNVDPYEAVGYWHKSPGAYKLEAYTADGKHLWTHDMGWSIEQGVWYSPYVVYDLDGDGRAEVYAKAGEGDPRDANGRVMEGPEWLVQIDGLTGQIKRKIPWPDRTGFDRYNYWSRNLMGVAYLDGKRPCLIVIRGTYSLIKVDAYDAELKCVWRWKSTDQKDRKYSAQGMHGMHAADVNGDGRDEIILGSAVLDANGRGLWSTEMGHPDACYVGEIDPNNPGLEIFYGIEPRKKQDAVMLVDARTGRKLWGFDGNTIHVHGQGMVADILPEYPGQECYAGEKDKSQFWLYAADGRRIGDRDIGGLAPRAVWWDADPQKEMVSDKAIRKFQGKTLLETDGKGKVVLIADILGDWREEVVMSCPGELRIYTTTIPATTRRTCLIQDRLYRLDVAAASMGYFYPPQLSGK